MKYIKLSELVPDPYQPRQEFEPHKLATLEESIKAKGILMPLVVEKTDDDKFLIIDGERRYRAAKRLGITDIPIEEIAKTTPAERMVTRFHLQEQHQSWSPFDKARAIYFFMQSEKMSASETARLLGLCVDTVISWVGILSLSKRTQTIVIEKRIPFSYLARIARLTKMYEEIIDMPVTEIEAKLIEKIDKKVLHDYTDLSKLLRLMKIDGNESKKIKFLNELNYTVKNLLAETPAGQSLEIDFVIFKVIRMNRLLKKTMSKKLRERLSYPQTKVLGELKETLETFDL